MEPLVYGDYPNIMRELVKDRLPIFTEHEKKLVKDSFDFIGINYYTSIYAKAIPIDPNATPTSYTDDQFIYATGVGSKPIINYNYSLKSHVFSLFINALLPVL